MLGEASGKLAFASSEGLVRKFLACEHDGGHLESLALHFLETRFARSSFGDCIGRALWPDHLVGRTFDFWDASMPTQSAPREMPVARMAAPDSLEARLRAGFMAVAGRQEARSSSRRQHAVVQKMPTVIVDPDEQGESSGEEDDETWPDKLGGLVDTDGRDKRGGHSASKKQSVACVTKGAESSSSGSKDVHAEAYASTVAGVAYTPIVATTRAECHASEFAGIAAHREIEVTCKCLMSIGQPSKPGWEPLCPINPQMHCSSHALSSEGPFRVI